MGSLTRGKPQVIENNVLPPLGIRPNTHWQPESYEAGVGWVQDLGQGRHKKGLLQEGAQHIGLEPSVSSRMLAV